MAHIKKVKKEKEKEAELDKLTKIPTSMSLEIQVPTTVSKRSTFC